MNKQITTMLQAVDVISKEIQGSTLDDQFILKMSQAEKVISEKLGTTYTQSLLMAMFVNHTFDDEITISDLFMGTECSTSRKLELMIDIETLVDNNYLVACRRNCREGKKYIIPDDIINSFQHNEKFHHKGYEKVTMRTLFCTIRRLFESRTVEEISYVHLVKEIKKLFDANNDLEFVRKVRSFDFSEEDKMLLIFFCNESFSYKVNAIDMDHLLPIYELASIRIETQSELSSGNHALLQAKLLEYANEDGFVNRDCFELTEKAKRNLLGELYLKSVGKGKVVSDVKRHKDIKSKELFFPSAVGKQVDELKEILKERNYKSICRRMKKKGFHSGFTCLFYGTPGTGKTETVYQLAKVTGRDVMLVDIPEIRSMWVGESEKNVKDIFTRYECLVKDSRRTPILLFNEADAIIGKRTMNHDSAVDKMENTMQNIILQEMEDLNGILIATTNLQDNMDKAFERRFLYKIEFDKPDALSRARIWHSMIPELDKLTVTSLANKYNFTGGQIENIARHYTIETILKNEKTVTLQSLNDFCVHESIKKDNKRIGFNL